MKQSELFERQKNMNLGAVIALAKRAKQTLSTNALDAVDQWQASNWSSGALEQAFRANSQLAHEITVAFDPVRQAIKSLYGDSITLYRGQRNFEQKELNQNRLLFSWSADEKVAHQFAIDAVLYQEITDQEIQSALAQYQKTGLCKLAGKTFKRSLHDPGYYEIYKGREHLGNDEEDSMADQFAEMQLDRRESNADYLSRGTIVKRQVSVDLIVWITNDLNSKEFIVKLNPLK